jgi:hypothetical protein
VSARTRYLVFVSMLDSNCICYWNYLFSGLISATTHLVIATLLLMAPPKTCQNTAGAKRLENPYPIQEIPIVCKQTLK